VRCLAAALAAGLACLPVQAASLAEGDAAWEARARGAVGAQPLRERIASSVAAYQDALDAEPDDVSVRWKLLRSLHFQGEFAVAEDDAKRAVFERGTRSGERGLELLSARAGGRLEELGPDAVREQVSRLGLPVRDVARLYFWTAIHWGAWSGTVGLLSAVREGVTDKMRDYTRVTLALEPSYDDGGAFRLLGRLHASLPRVPFLSGWVDREKALPLIEQGYALAPEHPGNRLLLAVTLLERAPARRDEARALLQAVADGEPRPSMRIEDLAIREEARQRLAELDELEEPAPAPDTAAP
jgi:hypothetical protein